MDSASSAPTMGKKRALRVAVSDDEEMSENDNIGCAVKSNGKGKGKAAKRARSLSPEEEETEEDEEEDQLGSDEDNTPAKRKKVKAEAKGKGKEKANGNGNGNGPASGHGNGSGGEEGSGEESEEEGGEPACTRPEYQRGADGYVAGSIVRMKLINFMTYDHVEFRPGPSLNMVLGPNGSGKSSIAAAIAIGLAFGPKVMARAEHVADYVKQYCDSAQIEMELKAFPEKKNPVIWVNITKEGKGATQWKLNNVSCTKKAVNEVVASFGVEADNLCSFLPQDKVAEFAKMKPREVLHETMYSAGDARLRKWFNDLIALDGNRLGLETKLEATRNERDLAQNQVNTLAPDVQHFEERERLEKQERILTCLWLAAMRCEMLRDVNLQKKRKTELKREMAKRINRSQPITNLQAMYQKKMSVSKKRVEVAERELRELDDEMRAIWRRLEKKSDNVNDIKRELGSIKKTVDREKKIKNDLLSRRKAAQEILDRPVEDTQSQLAEAQEAKKQTAADHQKAKREYEEVNEKYTETQRRMSELAKQIDLKTKQLDRLSSINNHKEDKAKMADPTLRYVLEWLPQHEAEFEEKIHKPAQISVNLKDKRFASQVESGVGWNARCTFIVTTARDYERLLALNRHRHGAGQTQGDYGGARTYGPGPVKPHIAQVTVDDSSLNPRKPCDRETLHRLGFDGWASDFVEAEPAVIAFLNEKCGLSRLAVCKGDGQHINAEENERAGIHQWATATEHVLVGRSKYGRKDTYQKSDPVKPASSFNVAVDLDGVKKLQDELISLKRAKRDIDQPAEDLRLSVADARETIGRLESELKELNHTIDSYRRENAHRLNAGTTIRKVDQELAALKTTDVDAKKAALNARMKTNLSDRLIIIKEAHQAQERYLSIATALGKRKLDLIQITADLKAIDAKIRATAADISDLEAGIRDSSATIKACTQNSAIYSKRFQNHFRDLLDDEQTELGTRLPEVEAPADDATADPQTSSEEVKSILQQVKANLSVSVGVDPSVVERYKRLVIQLEVLVKADDAQSKEYSTIRKKINKIMKVFDPALDDLIEVVNEKFSKAFELVGCTGEVKVDRAAEGYKEWGIQILVSYRNGDNLQQLTGSRQSGGERALATITYLMSLTSMSRTPFSLVDEINQGMDQTVERNVHNQLVGVTCNQEAGQYFLITPKLLTDLSYHPKMKILNVNNGPWLPAPNAAKWTQFSDCINQYRTANGMA